MTQNEKDSILNDYKWIKVKKYTDNPELSTEERLKNLSEHHKLETEFLINKIREIVSSIKP